MRECLTEEVMFCDGIVDLSATQRDIKRRSSLHGERTCPVQGKPSCFICLEYRVYVEVAVVTVGDRN